MTEWNNKQWKSEQDSTEVLDCFTVIVGRDASVDGSVLLGHNEQNRGKRIINFRKIPQMEYESGSMIALKNGGKIPQVEKTGSFLWTESPGLEFSDSYLNEWGVAIVSDSCPTKEDEFGKLVERGDVVDGGVGYMLIRIAAARARSAREAMEIICGLIERFGYSASGRSISIADQNEAWVLSIVAGKHWIAERVPDDGIVLVPNVHIIGPEAILTDHNNVLHSKGLVEYATSRGWYNPDSGKLFSFREAFNGNSREAEFMAKYHCDSRQWYSQCLVTEQQIQLPVKEQLPFSVQAQRRYNIADVTRILRSHLEGTEFDFTKAYTLGSPHAIANEARNICSSTTQESVVYQLRNWLSSEVGCVAWRATFSPCSSVYTPWYLGILETPAKYYKQSSVQECLKLKSHFSPPDHIFTYDSKFAFWVFYTLENLVSNHYIDHIEIVQKAWDEVENRQYHEQENIERIAMELMTTDKELAMKFLTMYSAHQSGEAIALAEELSDLLVDRIYKKNN